MRKEGHQRVLASVGLITALLAATVADAGLLSRIKDSMNMSNTKFAVLDTAAVGAITKVAIVNGLSLQFDKKSKSYSEVVLECSDKMRQKLCEEMREKNKQVEVISPDDDHGTTVIAQLIDPYKILSRKEAKELTGEKPDEAVISLELREWSECRNCTALADSLKVDAVWVIWSRWFTNEEDMSKVEYSDKDKGWLHTTAELFSTIDGHLIACTAINRSGVGVGPFVKSSAAYGFIAGGMVDNYRKYAELAQKQTSGSR